MKKPNVRIDRYLAYIVLYVTRFVYEENQDVSAAKAQVLEDYKSWLSENLIYHYSFLALLVFVIHIIGDSAH